MTPHIIRQYDKIRTILDKKLRERDEFLEESTGGSDPLRGKRDEIIRSLPDLKELIEKHPPTTVILDEEKDMQNKGGNSSSGARFINPGESRSETQGQGTTPSVPPLPSGAEGAMIPEGTPPALEVPSPMEAAPNAESVAPPPPVTDAGVTRAQ